MTDYRKILMLRSMGCSQREMERNKVASRETSKAVLETANRLGICWPLYDDITKLNSLVDPRWKDNMIYSAEPNQNFLDRMSEWSIVFFLDSNNRWVNVYIIVNDWVVRINDAEL